ncbi:hypothetical protein GCM10009837_13780 [Streptomyces durmitorensis]
MLGGAREQLLVVLCRLSGAVRVLLGRRALLLGADRPVHQRLGEEQGEETGREARRSSRHETAAEQGQDR